MKRLVLEKALVKKNLGTIRLKTGFAKIIGVVKGNGYGFGICEFSRLLIENGIEMLAVSNIEEAQSLRDGGITAPVLLMSPTEIREYAERAVRLGVTAAVGSVESAVLLNTAAKEAGVTVEAHVLIDTGMGRFGFLPEECSKIITASNSLTNVKLTGIFSHLSASFVKKKKPTKAQVEAFSAVIKELEAAGMSFEYRHIANSCAIFLHPYAMFNCVRAGSAIIGRLPSGIKSGLCRCGYLECDVDSPRYLPAGHNIGYANTYKTKKPIRIAVAGAGYGDGICVRRDRDALRFRDRLRYLKDEILFLIRPRPIICRIGGKPVRLIGRAGLTNCVLDVSGAPCEAGSKAVFDINPLFVGAHVEREYR